MYYILYILLQASLIVILNGYTGQSKVQETVVLIVALPVVVVVVQGIVLQMEKTVQVMIELIRVVIIIHLSVSNLLLQLSRMQSINLYII